MTIASHGISNTDLTGAMARPLIRSTQRIGNTQLLIQRAEDDLKLDNSWMYLGFQRRVRRLATGQTTDAFLGSDVMIEDFEGYNGRVSDMKWTFKGSRKC
jgi:hypothetical protein